MCTSALHGRVQLYRHLSASSMPTLENCRRVAWSRYLQIIMLIVSSCLVGITWVKSGDRWPLQYLLVVRKLQCIGYLSLYLVTWWNRIVAEWVRLVELMREYSIRLLYRDLIVPHPGLFYWRLEMSMRTIFVSLWSSCLQLFLCGIGQMDMWTGSSLSC